MQIPKQLYCICFLLPSFILVNATLKCEIIGNQQSDVKCTPTDDTDYIIQRGLVSDNNKTISVTLRGCRISEVEYEAFENLFALELLDLSQNKISKLKLGVLDGIVKMKHLNLSHNSLADFPLGLFDENPNLNVLDLKGNKINNLELGIFDPLTKLQWLDLSNNALLGKDFNPYIFDQSKKITFISFAKNNMDNSPENLLHAFEALETLNLDRSLITKVPLFATRNNLNTLRNLILSSNLIKKLEDPTIFINLNNLHTLNLADNIIKSIDNNVFKTLKKLKVIILRGNMLTSLPVTLFKDLKSLGNIDLSHNQITNMPVDAFRGTSLKNLNIANNRITYLVDNFCLELMNSGAKLSKFYFHQNPWQCTCLRVVLDEVKKYQIAYSNIFYDGRTPVCVTTNELFCKRHDEFNRIYIELYDNLILGKQIDE